MGTVTTLPRGRALTREDLATMPDDGRRYELVDGSLVVTPAPSRRHQSALGELHLLLRAGCPPDLKVLFAPFDVALAEDTVVQPDLLVASRSAFTERDLPAAPLLVIEVLSPSTRHIDIGLKRARYETAGCPSYWVVDPDEPSLTAAARGRPVRRDRPRRRTRGVRRHLAVRRHHRASRPARLTQTEETWLPLPLEAGTPIEHRLAPLGNDAFGQTGLVEPLRPGLGAGNHLVDDLPGGLRKDAE